MYARLIDGGTAMVCLSDETMAAIADGTLAAEERRAAMGHVDECASCRQVLAGVVTLDGW
jgi:hypothetical protein